ncbi:hypothetical protein BC2903_11420 [Bacillus cereus]|nr:hypothetical protein C1640_03515 [Bacillus sp. AKBS9]GCF67323.1 hypothetical protein BC2903_11420 [Bacillus cereus]
MIDGKYKANYDRAFRIKNKGMEIVNIDEQILRNRYQRIQDVLRVTSSVRSEEERIKIYKQFKPRKASRKLRIAYIMNHTRVCGGAKIILEHTNQLVDKGHDVFIICRDAKPDWKKIKAKYIQVKQQSDFVEYIPDVDLIVCTVADQVPECYLLGRAPVILFEQGDKYIYEFDSLSSSSKALFKEIWGFPIPVFGVSKVLMKTLEENFGCQGHVIHNALDRNHFYPEFKRNKFNKKIKLMFVGQEDNEFKGIAIIREALKIVKETGRDFDEVWVTQTTPISQFEGELVVNPSQQKLGDVYRSSDIFVSGSYYESFPLPPLEAMTCGCAVVSTDNDGIKEYAIDGENCLLGKVGDSYSLAKCIIALLDNEEKRNRLVFKGYETAKKFNWKRIINLWEKFLFGAIEAWEYVEQSRYIPTLRIEVLPANINPQTAKEYISGIQASMLEDYCLWLGEGEEIGEKDVLYLQRILAFGGEMEYGIRVIYQNYIRESTALRIENRIIKKNNKFLNDNQNKIALPIEINKGSCSFFIPYWMREIREYYLNQEYDYSIAKIHSLFLELSIKEKVIAMKWLVLCLIEKEQYVEAINILKQAVKIAPSYTDLYYLACEIYSVLGEEVEGLRNIIIKYGPSLEYNEAFLEYK